MGKQQCIKHRLTASVAYVTMLTYASTRRCARPLISSSKLNHVS